MIDKLSNMRTQTNDSQVKQVEDVPIVKEVKNEKKDQKDQNLNEPITKEKLEKVINGMNDFLKESSTHLKFNFHEELKRYYVSIVDDTTNEVIKEIPPKKLLDMYAAMTDYLGLLVDKKA